MTRHLTLTTIMKDARVGYSDSGFLRMVFTIITQTVYYVLDRLLPVSSSDSRAGPWRPSDMDLALGGGPQSFLLH